MHYPNLNHLTGDEAAALLCVHRRTVYRWIDDGRLTAPLTRSEIEERNPKPRKRGPARNPESKRYTEGGHAFNRPKTGL